jgi:hypothetical protein
MTPDEIRRSALDTIERQERFFKMSFFGAVAFEGLFLIAFLALMDLNNRTHTLLLVGTVATYTIVVLGLVALGAMANRNTARIIRAIEVSK